MYQITIDKVIYTKTTRGTRKDTKRIATEKNIPLREITSRMIKLKHIYRDFSYIIEFVKI